jgi:hypothetical protein
MHRSDERRLLALGHTTDDPATRFRIGQYIPSLERAGWLVSLRTNRPPRPWQSPVRNPALKGVHRRLGVWRRRVNRWRDIRSAAGFDAVFLNRDVLESDVRYERYLLRRNPRLIFDFDDAVFLGGKETHAAWVCRRAAWVTAGNADLADFARRFTDRVTVLPTVIDTDAYAPSGPRPGGTPFRVGWCGSEGSIRQTLFPYIDMLARIQRRLGFEFVIMSRPRPQLAQTPLRWTYEEWDENKETRLGSFFDAGIMPLTSDEYQRYKCGCKLLQYMASWLPSIASPVGINVRMIETGHGGFLAATEDDWLRAIERLMLDERTCRDMGAAGRAYVVRDYSLRAWLPVLLDLLDRVAGIPAGGSAKA